MFRASCLPRKRSVVLLRGRLRNVFRRGISGKAEQEIANRLLSQKPIVHFDQLTRKRKEQFNAAIHGLISIADTSGALTRKHLPTCLPPGQHLLYFNTVVPTDQLLPDGTDVAHWPGEPYNTRLWAGGRIKFPQTKELDIDSPHLLLAEYVRDVRIAGPEGKEKIFVKIERRVGARPPQAGLRGARDHALQLRRDREASIGNSLIVETRDLCFLRETGSTVPFKRRIIAPPTESDYSLSLIPSPALLFRFSALTFNAHAIHIDPEYTRKVYGFPNLLVHGPLTLVLMLEFMRQILLGLPGSGYAPVITEINYRNLAPLFADEEMTICVKKKPRSDRVSSFPRTHVVDSDLDSTRETSTPTSNDDSVVSARDKHLNRQSQLPSQAEATKSGSGRSKGSQILPAGIAAAEDGHSESKFKSQTSDNLQSATAVDAGEYPQEWEIWVQTGQRDAASLAVRGTIKVEEFDEVKQLYESNVLYDPRQQDPIQKEHTSDVIDRKPGPSGLTADEIHTLRKVKSILERRDGMSARRDILSQLDKESRHSRGPVGPDIPMKEHTDSEAASLPSSRTNRKADHDLQQPPKLVHYTTKYRRFSTRAPHVSVMSTIPQEKSIRHVPCTLKASTKVRVRSTFTAKGRLLRPILKDLRFSAAEKGSSRLAKSEIQPRKVLRSLLRPHNPKTAYNVVRGVNMHDIHFVRGRDGIKQNLVRGADEDDIDVQDILASHLVADPLVGPKVVTSTEGAFERTLRIMLEGK